MDDNKWDKGIALEIKLLNLKQQQEYHVLVHTINTILE
jgi:hypothetical protein